MNHWKEFSLELPLTALKSGMFDCGKVTIKEKWGDRKSGGVRLAS